MPLRRTAARLTEVEVDGEIAVYHPDTDRVVLLNASASQIWRHGAELSSEELVAHLVQVFGIDEAEARRGVEAGVSLLRAEHLLEPG